MDGQGMGGNDGVLTPDELVRLAEYCGHEVAISGDEAWLRRFRGSEERWGEREKRWQPHLDANQEREVIQALYDQKWHADVSHHPWHGRLCTLHNVVDGRRFLSNWESAPGLAVCWAALGVIE